jgi:type IV pilus assembly protein PilE
MHRGSGVTLIEILTIVVVLVVVAAVAIPLWRTRELRAHRQAAIDALVAIQAAQDRHFGEHARYAGAPGLGIENTTAEYTLQVELGKDELSYVAIARAGKVRGAAFDSRCAELGLDQNGRRFAKTESGQDSTDDCWNRQ